MIMFGFKKFSQTGIRLAIIPFILATITACDSKTEDSNKEELVVQRTDYTPEEFGMGRSHTQSKYCNKKIDALLNKIRLCYKKHGSSKTCDAVQKKSNKKIYKFRNSYRCKK